MLGVGDNVQSSRSLFDPSSRSSFDPSSRSSYEPSARREDKDVISQVISLEPATDLTAEDIEEMDQVFQNKNSNVDDDVVEISHQVARGPPRQRRPQALTTHSSSDGGRGFITAGSTIGSSFVHDNVDHMGARSQESTFNRPPREPSPPKRQVTMVDLSQASLPEEKPFESPVASVRPELLMSARNDVGQPMSQTQTMSSDQTPAMAIPVPVALHVARPTDPSGSIPMETVVSIDPSASSDIKQEADDSFDDCFLATGLFFSSQHLYKGIDSSHVKLQCTAWYTGKMSCQHTHFPTGFSLPIQACALYPPKFNLLLFLWKRVHH